jgi:hypothetical protein
VLLAAALFGVAGCGQPSGESGGPGGSASAPMSMEGTYDDTGLPKQFEHGGKKWEIQQDIDAPEGSYEKGAEQVDGKPLYHDLRAEPPYPLLYLRVEGKDRYLQYAPAGG